MPGDHWTSRRCALQPKLPARNRTLRVGRQKSNVDVTGSLECHHSSVSLVSEHPDAHIVSRSSKLSTFREHARPELDSLARLHRVAPPPVTRDEWLRFGLGPSESQDTCPGHFDALTKRDPRSLRRPKPSPAKGSPNDDFELLVFDRCNFAYEHLNTIAACDESDIITKLWILVELPFTVIPERPKRLFDFASTKLV